MNQAPAVRPDSVEALAEVLRAPGSWRLVGRNSQAAYRLPADTHAATLDLSGLSGIVEFQPNDQVVVVRAGTPIEEVQHALHQRGQCLPIVEWHDGWSHLNAAGGSIGGAVSMALPEYLDGECGTWRDWVLGMTVVRADGTIAKTGSQAVKNVAGYDAHKLFIGARGTLVAIAEVILRTYPVKSLPQPQVRWHDGVKAPSMWIQRTLASDFEEACRHSTGYTGGDFPSSSTLWRMVPPEESLRRFPGDWVVRSGCGADNLRIEDATLAHYMRRAKEILDPHCKLNPGEMGIF
jgi:hypothetical protein